MVRKEREKERETLQIKRVGAENTHARKESERASFSRYALSPFIRVVKYLCV